MAVPDQAGLFSFRIKCCVDRAVNIPRKGAETVIYTVTLNPALDKTVEIPLFSPGKVNRVRTLRLDAGGKGVNVTKCLAALGCESTAALLLGGSSGEKLRGMLHEQGMKLIAVSVHGETRTNLKIRDPERRSNTDINEPGPCVSREHLDELKNLVAARLRPGDTLILSGSLPIGAPADTYSLWCGFFRSLGASVILDADGEAMREGVKALPNIIKPNEEELSRLMGRELDTVEKLAEAGMSLLDSGIGEVIISMGERGGLFLSSGGCFRAEGLAVPVNSTVGAGDAVVAAVAYGMEKGLDREARIRLAMAMGTASVMCVGTQAPDIELVQRLAGQIRLHGLKM